MSRLVKWTGWALLFCVVCGFPPYMALSHAPSSRQTPPPLVPRAASGLVKGADDHDYTTFTTLGTMPGTGQTFHEYWMPTAAEHSKACRACAANRHTPVDPTVAFDSDRDTRVGLIEGGDHHEHVTFQHSEIAGDNQRYLSNAPVTVLHSQECSRCMRDLQGVATEPPTS